MTGGLLNLVSYGSNDLYLTGSPQITFFKIAYRRHTNFAREVVPIACNNMNFNEEITIKIPQYGDLMSNIFIQFQIPEINLQKTDLATNLTNTQTNYLTTTTTLNMDIDEQNIANDYQTILSFISINTIGYRKACLLQNVINQSTTDFIYQINSVLNYNHDEDTNYQIALQNAYTYEDNIGNTKILNILNSKNSNIKQLINSINVSTYSISQIMNIINNAIKISIKVKAYYFSKVQKLHNSQQDANSKIAKFAWINRLGYAMIDRVDINIGGEKIDRHYGDFMNIWFELTTSINQKLLYDKLLGDITSLTSFDRNIKPTTTITIPLTFWFCRKIGLAFPLIALQYNPVSLVIRLKSFDQCAYVETLPLTDNYGNDLNFNQISLTDIWDNKGLVLSPTLLIEYIYLDGLERKRFAQSAHEYLIETIDTMQITDVSNQDQNIDLDFSGPCKELIWFAQKSAYLNSEPTLKKYPFIYSCDQNINTTVPYASRTQFNPINDFQLLLNGKTRFPYSHPMLFNLLGPLVRHTKIPSIGINTHSFGLFPEEHQPSGTCNFTVISSSSFTFTMDSNIFNYYNSDINPSIEFGSENDAVNNTSVNITIYSKRYNVLRFIGGFGAFAYSYNS
jgi:hypothetical protein